MKTTIFLLVLLLAFNCSYSQKKKKKKKGQKDVATWFFASVGGKYGNSMLMNNRAATADSLNLNSMNPSMGFDVDLGVNFPFGVSLMVGFDQVAFKQKYDVNSINNNYSLTSSGTIILFRVISENNAYFEVGPKFNSLRSSSSESAANTFKSSYTSIAFGVGGTLYWHQNFDITLGARFGYGMNMTNSGSTLFGNDKTSVLDAQLRLAFNWHIGYFRQAGCDKHIEFLMF